MTPLGTEQAAAAQLVPLQSHNNLNTFRYNGQNAPSHAKTARAPATTRAATTPLAPSAGTPRWQRRKISTPEATWGAIRTQTAMLSSAHDTADM